MVAKPKDDIRTGAEGHVPVPGTGTHVASSRRGPSAPPPKQATNDLRPLEALDNQSPTDSPDKHTLASGVVLRLKKFNRTIAREIYQSVPDPEPPVIHDSDRGVDEVNTEDPDYRDALEETFLLRNRLWMDYILMAATELHPDYSLPDGIDHPDSDEWLAVAEHIGYRFDPRKRTRYLAWLKLVALGNIEDSNNLAQAISRYNGTLEEDVAAAVASFPDNVAGGATPGS